MINAAFLTLWELLQRSPEHFWLKNLNVQFHYVISSYTLLEHTSFTYHAHDANFILNKILLCPLLLKSPVFFFYLLLLQFTFVYHGLYLGSE